VTPKPFRFGAVVASAPSADAWVARVRRIEELGYATLLMPDRLVGPILSPLPALSVAAAATTRLRVGTFVLAAGLRNPVVLAREVAALDFLSGGRFELGLGAGVGEVDFRQAGVAFGRPGARAERVAETLRVVKGLLGGERVTSFGPSYAVDGAEVFPRPARRPPILVAAGGRRMVELAAREADVIAFGVDPRQGESALAERVEWARAAAGGRLPEIELSLNLVAVLPPEGPPPSVRGRVLAVFGVELAELAKAGSAFVLTGDTDAVCEQLAGLRERLGVSYVTVADDTVEQLAPVVERLAGR
jgi:probable F420-dependent oxidoreductase